MTIDKFPHFTVIIPCKNRASFLHHTLRTCVMQNYERLEIIVSDDGSNDNTREVVENAADHDSRVNYVLLKDGMGMLDNFEFALRQVKPGYVIALGGDDGLLPNGIAGMNEVLQSTGTELLAWPAPIYTYPGARTPTGQLSIYYNKRLKIIDSKRFLHRQAKNLHYLSDIESPMFYVKGVASTQLIDRVRKRSKGERFYSCPTPDGYSGIVLAGEVSKYSFSGKPFSIFGLSPASQGLAYLSNDVKAKKNSENFFNNLGSKFMHFELAEQPYSPLITLMTVDYLLTARDLPGWPGVFPEINFREVLIKAIKELSHGLYGEERICRELSILNKIAEKHGLGDFFIDRVKHSKRYVKKTPFEGDGINTSAFFLDADKYKINDIFDASYAVQNIYQFYYDFKPSFFGRIITKSLIYKYRSLGVGNSFPHESNWTND